MMAKNFLAWTVFTIAGVLVNQTDWSWLSKYMIGFVGGVVAIDYTIHLVMKCIDDS